MSAEGERVSLAEVARLAGVQRPAVSNWKRRHPDFPEPVEDGTLFDLEDVAAWLDDRRVPANALRPGEAPGTTFGDRVRGRTEAQEESAGTQEPAPESRSLADELMTVLERVRGFADPGTYGELALELLYHRAIDPQGWRHLRRVALDAPTSYQHVLDVWSDLRRRESLTEGPPLPREAGGHEAIRAFIGAIDELAPPPGLSGDLRRRGRPDAARQYEQVLARFAQREGRRGGEFYTPRSVVQAMAGLVAPGPGEHIHDPCCGTGELLTGAVEHARGHAPSGAPPTRVTGASLTARGRRITEMNLLVQGAVGRIRTDVMEAVHRHPTGHEAFDVVTTNPPFGLVLAESARREGPWRYGEPPPRPADFAWLQYALALLSARGRAAVLTPNGATFRTGKAERSIRASMVEDGVVDCVVALPPNLFASTGISVSLWILRAKAGGSGGVLLIDASGAGETRPRSVRTLTAADISKITTTYHRWRDGRFADEPGFARHVDLAEIRARDHSLNPRAYVLPGPVPADARSWGDDVHRLTDDLTRLQTRAARLDLRLDRLLRGGS